MEQGFTRLDLVVVIVYFVAVVIFGLWVARKAKTSDSYFRGERKFKWWIMIGQAFGTGTHAEMPVAQAGATFDKGFATIWYQWKNMLITPFYWLMAPWYRRSDRTTVGELVEDRYGRQLAFIYSVFAICYFIFNQGAMLSGAAKVISVATGGMLTREMVILGMTAAFLLYSFFGGLIASAYTDFVQGFLIIVLSFMLIPAGLHLVGGFVGLHQTLTPGFFKLYDPEVSKLTWFTIAMLAVNGVVGITAQPHTMSMNATGNTERAGRVGQTYGAMVKRFCTIGWAFTGLIVAAIIIQRGTTLSDPEMAFGFASRELLMPGLTGLMVAAILAANMSTCSNFMVNTGAIFTRNFYCEFLKPKARDKEILWVGRFSGLFLTMMGVVFALYVTSVLHAFLFTETIAAFMGIIVFGGFMWKRANRYGALMAVVVSFGLYYTLNCAATPIAGTHWAPHWNTIAGIGNAITSFFATHQLQLVYKWTPEPFGWAMLAGFGALVAFSLITKPESKAKIEEFFDKQNRVSDEPNLAPGEPKPLASTRGKDMLLIDFPGWFTAARWQGFFTRYKEDLIGFALAWVTVGVLIGAAWGLMQIGK